jgi:hypothetical protein
MANIALTYKKYLSAPYVDVLVYDGDPVWKITYSGKPSWLKMIVQAQTLSGTYERTSLTYRVAIDPEFANQLAPGFHTAKITIYAGTIYGTYIVNTIDVTVEILETVRLSISKGSYAFAYVQGSPVPATQPLTISTENAWSIIGTQPWLSFSANNGPGTQTIQLAVDVSGLAIGIYEATFQVDDGGSVKQGTVSLLISGSEESGDFLILSRRSLSFSEIFQAAPTRSANVGIESSLAVTLTTATPWLNLSAAGFAAGTNQLLINTQATEGLALGNYTGNIRVETGFSVKNISVLLRIVQELTEGIESGKLYYADDRNVLILGTATPNAEAFIEFDATASGKMKTYSRRVPYFNDLAEVIIGLETNALLKPDNLPSIFTSGVFIPVKPLEMNFTVFDKVINSTAITERSGYTGVKFLNGRTPKTEDRLSDIPAQITVPKDALISFSFYSEAAIAEIGITGAITASIPIAGIDTKIYAAVVDLSTYVLAGGDKITITCGGHSVLVTIKPSELSTYRLIWLNQWDCPEVMSLDGIIEIIEEEDSKTVSVAEAGKEISRIIEILEPRSFKIGTGNIYSDAEANWLSGILRSKKMWLEIEGNRVEVVRTFRSISVSKTRQFSRNYNLTFDAAIK